MRSPRPSTTTAWRSIGVWQPVPDPRRVYSALIREIRGARFRVRPLSLCRSPKPLLEACQLINRRLEAYIWACQNIYIYIYGTPQEKQTVFQHKYHPCIRTSAHREASAASKPCHPHLASAGWKPSDHHLASAHLVQLYALIWCLQGPAYKQPSLLIRMWGLLY